MQKRGDNLKYVQAGLESKDSPLHTKEGSSGTCRGQEWCSDVSLVKKCKGGLLAREKVMQTDRPGS